MDTTKVDKMFRFLAIGAVSIPQSTQKHKAKTNVEKIKHGRIYEGKAIYMCENVMLDDTSPTLVVWNV